MKKLFKDIKINQHFYIDYESGKWIYYKKVNKDSAEIVSLSERRDFNLIGNITSISEYKLVTPK